MANPEHVVLVRKGAKAIAEWRAAHPDERLDLSGADLSKTDLQGADLSGANLREADLERANLGRANLTGGFFLAANLYTANLKGADLNSAHFELANLTMAGLSGADLSQAHVGFTILANVYLAETAGLGTVVNEAPSSVGVDTLIASFRGAGNRLTPELRAFFRGAGVPEELLDALPKIISEIEYYSCFISYGQPDLKFAEKLREDLKGKGVDCWLYEKDKTIGKRTGHEIVIERRGAEKMVVLCSAKALVRDRFLEEIEDQINEDPNKMVPISLDDLWKEPGFRVMRGTGDLKPFL
ncbi:MAG: toll/interleukin-1 receptor domain-containing protein [Dehalococcoidia bacterium]|nr:toll/interleukin-1 receptor domain-containing protein [Dehalococcoidia bacterium]